MRILRYAVFRYFLIKCMNLFSSINGIPRAYLEKHIPLYLLKCPQFGGSAVPNALTQQCHEINEATEHVILYLT